MQYCATQASTEGQRCNDYRGICWAAVFSIYNTMPIPEVFTYWILQEFYNVLLNNNVLSNI